MLDKDIILEPTFELRTPLVRFVMLAQKDSLFKVNYSNNENKDYIKSYSKCSINEEDNVKQRTNPVPCTIQPGPLVFGRLFFAMGPL